MIIFIVYITYTYVCLLNQLYVFVQVIKLVLINMRLFCAIYTFYVLFSFYKKIKYAYHNSLENYMRVEICVFSLKAINLGCSFSFFIAQRTVRLEIFDLEHISYNINNTFSIFIGGAIDYVFCINYGFIPILKIQFLILEHTIGHFF